MERMKLFPDCGISSEVVLVLKTGEHRVLKQADNMAECGKQDGASTKPLPQGYEDPRLFSWLGEPYVLMNGCKKGRRKMYLHDIHRNATVQLSLESGDTVDTTQKNWTPFEDRGKLRFIYSFGEAGALGVLELIDKTCGVCSVIFGSAVYDPKFEFAGSTQMLQWVHPYFVGFVHTRHGPQPTGLLPDQRVKYVYRAVPVVLNVRCPFSDRDLHSRMPLVPKPVRLKRAGV
jgi:hypothetical protein